MTVQFRVFSLHTCLQGLFEGTSILLQSTVFSVETISSNYQGLLFPSRSASEGRKKKPCDGHFSLLSQHTGSWLFRSRLQRAALGQAVPSQNLRGRDLMASHYFLSGFSLLQVSQAPWGIFHKRIQGCPPAVASRGAAGLRWRLAPRPGSILVYALLLSCGLIFLLLWLLGKHGCPKALIRTQ